MDPQWQQSVGIWGIAIGVLVMGSAPHILDLPQSQWTVLVGLILLGGFQGLAMPTQPVIALRVLKKSAGLEKKDVAGALVATFMTVSMMGACVAPLIATSLVEATSSGSTTELIAGAIAVGYVPLFIWLRRFVEGPPGCKEKLEALLFANPACSRDDKSGQNLWR